MMSFMGPLLSLILILGVTLHSLAFRVGLILDRGGKDDRSFNQSAYEGIVRAKKELGIEYKYVEAPDFIAIENFLRAMSRKKFDLIICIGFAQADAIKKIAPLYPQAKFAIVDGFVELPNVSSLLFEEHEGSYLVGALAAMKSKTAKIGFVGGMEIPLIRRFQLGFETGVKSINPKATTIVNYVGVTGEAWNNPAKAKQLALSQYNEGVDVIFVAAGASGNGVFDAAEESGKLAIGVDSNQNWMKPGFILTSMLKKVDQAVYNAIQNTKDGKFQAGVIRNGLKNNGIDYSLDSFNEKLLTPDLKTKVDEIKIKIIQGQILVPDFYLKK